MATFNDRRGGERSGMGGTVYEFHPVGMDQYDPKPHHPAPGTRVRVDSKQSGVGTRPPGAMGKDYRYIANAETGQFHGMVLRNSLRRVAGEQRAPKMKNPDPARLGVRTKSADTGTPGMLKNGRPLDPRIKPIKKKS